MIRIRFIDRLCFQKKLKLLEKCKPGCDQLNQIILYQYILKPLPNSVALEKGLYDGGVGTKFPKMGNIIVYKIQKNGETKARKSGVEPFLCLPPSFCCMAIKL